MTLNLKHKKKAHNMGSDPKRSVTWGQTPSEVSDPKRSGSTPPSKSS